MALLKVQIDEFSTSLGYYTVLSRVFPLEQFMAEIDDTFWLPNYETCRVNLLEFELEASRLGFYRHLQRL